MKYQIKWIEENLGITRKAIRNYEKIGLIKQSPNYKGNNGYQEPKYGDAYKYRTYDDDEIQQLWGIRVLQGVGYTLKEIKELQIDKLSSENALANKIKELEKEKEKIENSIGYAKMIKMTGRMPGIPEDIKVEKPSTYTDKALENWNVNNDELFEKAYRYIGLILGQGEIKTPNNIDEALNVLESSVSLFQRYPESLSIGQFYVEIAKRVNKGYEIAEVQLLVHMIYDNMKVMAERDEQELTIDMFGKATIPQFIYGDFRLVNTKKYGDIGCDFIANAIAYYVGYKDYESMKGILI